MWTQFWVWTVPFLGSTGCGLYISGVTKGCGLSPFWGQAAGVWVPHALLLGSLRGEGQTPWCPSQPLVAGCSLPFENFCFKSMLGAPQSLAYFQPLYILSTFDVASLCKDLVIQSFW